MSKQLKNEVPSYADRSEDVLTRFMAGEAPDDGDEGGGADDEAAKAAAAKAAKDAADAAAAAEAKRLEEEAAKKHPEKAALLKEKADLLKETMRRKAKEKELTDQLKKFDGIDPEKVKDLLKAAADAEEAKKAAEKKALEEAGDFKRLQEMMKEEHKKEVEDLKKAAGDTKTALDAALAQINELTIGSAFAQSTFVAEKLVLPPQMTRKVYESHFEIENGDVVAYDKPKGASERTKLVNGSGDPLGFDAAIQKLVESSSDRDRLLKAALKGGANSKTDDSKGSNNSKSKDGEVKGMTRIQAALERGALKPKK